MMTVDSTFALLARRQELVTPLEQEDRIAARRPVLTDTFCGEWDELMRAAAGALDAATDATRPETIEAARLLVRHLSAVDPQVDRSSRFAIFSPR